VNEAVDKRSDGNRPYIPRVNTGPMKVTELAPIVEIEIKNKNHSSRRRRRNRSENDWDAD
jgi:hypothetical protein